MLDKIDRQCLCSKSGRRNMQKNEKQWRFLSKPVTKQNSTATITDKIYSTDCSLVSGVRTMRSVLPNSLQSLNHQFD